MRTLSIRNPWADLVAFGVKDVENRSWKTDYRGEFLIHASGDPLGWINLKDLPSDFEKRVMEALDLKTPYDDLEFDLRRYSDLITHLATKLEILGTELSDFQKAFNAAMKSHAPPMQSHAVIGRCELVDVVHNSPSVWSQPFKYHWIIKNAEVFENPIVGVKGKLRFWDFDI